jgi:hypothetical protein
MFWMNATTKITNFGINVSSYSTNYPNYFNYVAQIRT